MRNQQELVTKKGLDSTIKLAKMSMLVAIAVIFANIHFPIFAPTPFLKYDPADIPILIGGFTFGPLAGFCITVIASILQEMFSGQSGVYGIIMHIIATGTLVVVATSIHKFTKTKKMAFIGLVAGTFSMTIVMVLANYIVTPIFLNAPVTAITAILPYIIGFNLVKAGVNSIVTFVLYKRVSKFLHKQ